MHTPPATAPPLVSSEIESIRPYEPGRPIDEVRRELGIDDPVKLASNENAWGPSPRAVEAIARAAAEVHLYPDGGAYHLRQAVAARLGVDPAQIVFGNGSNEVLELVVRAFVQPGQNVVASEVSFIAYKLLTLAAGRELREAPLGPDMGYDLDAMLDRVDDRTRVIFLANPNNPTGTVIGRDALARFLAAVDARCGADPPVVVLDEAYLEFVDRPDHPSALAILAARPRTVVTRTFSKAYGLAGLRCGFGVTSPRLADYLNRVREPFNLNSLAQVAALAALADEAHLAEVVRATRAGRHALTSALAARGLRVVPSEANFVLVDFARDGLALHERLMRAGVICRPMAPYGLSTWLRVTVGRPEENQRLLDALAATL